MHEILKKLLNRGGIKDISELNSDERFEYDRIIKELEAGVKPIIPEDWEEFLEKSLEGIIISFNPDDSEKKKDFIWSQIFLLQKLLVYLKGPKREEERIKKSYNI